ncbi:MAG: 6-phosphofructokinase [Eubacteriales bacterium]|nr:6-phosphofructokinase [Clostridiales bacterium]MDY5836868.1 6-phosphofructokinase [Eubacteriales bacterium]
MKGNLIYGQSGGPTSVINASAAGVFLEALSHSAEIEKVYAAHHGIVGILQEDFFDMGQEDPQELKLLKQTPSSALGSCRYKLAALEDDETDYARILEVFKKYNIRYFFYNGGNDSMDTCSKVSQYLRSKNYDCRVIGVPKTIDNDLAVTDHCPGYGSAARYIATTLMEIYQDATVYDAGQITFVEIMGRHAGWLAAASAVAAAQGCGPDLIYLPERVFDLEKVIADIQEVYDRKGKVIVCFSEGVKTADGKFIPELDPQADLSVDAFGHKQLGGAAETLAKIVGTRIPTKIRAIELSLMQRCAAHLASERDVEDSFRAGQAAVQAALAGKTDIMIGFARPDQGAYQTQIQEIPLEVVANAEKKLPDAWINAAGNGLEEPFLDYIMPLISGQPERILDPHGLPRFARLKFVQAGQKVDK